VVCAIDPASLSAEQAMSDAEALQDLGQQLRVHGVRRLTDVTTRELHTLRGFRSTTAWLRHTQPDADSSDAGLSRRLQGYQRPELAEPTLVDPDLVDPDLRYPRPSWLTPSWLTEGLSWRAGRFRV